MTYNSHRFSKQKGGIDMLARKKELTQEQILDAEKFCQLKEGGSISEWPFLRTILMAYMDGIGTGLQISEQEENKYRANISIERNKCT
jgi:hypothetical protein